MTGRENDVKIWSKPSMQDASFQLKMRQQTFGGLAMPGPAGVGGVQSPVYLAAFGRQGLGHSPHSLSPISLRHFAARRRGQGTGKNGKGVHSVQAGRRTVTFMINHQYKRLHVQLNCTKKCCGVGTPLRVVCNAVKHQEAIRSKQCLNCCFSLGEIKKTELRSNLGNHDYGGVKH